MVSGGKLGEHQRRQRSALAKARCNQLWIAWLCGSWQPISLTMFQSTMRAYSLIYFVKAKASLSKGVWIMLAYFKRREFWRSTMKITCHQKLRRLWTLPVRLLRLSSHDPEHKD